jgi:hypothetical protein
MAPVGDLCLLACAVPHTTKAAYGHVMRSMASQHCVQEQPGGNNVQGGSCADATAPYGLRVAMHGAPQHCVQRQQGTRVSRICKGFGAARGVTTEASS